MFIVIVSNVVLKAVDLLRLLLPVEQCKNGLKQLGQCFSSKCTYMYRWILNIHHVSLDRICTIAVFPSVSYFTIYLTLSEFLVKFEVYRRLKSIL